jgi:hypothetical protein
MRSASNVSHALDHVKGAASGMHASLLDLGARAMTFLNATRSQRVRALEQIGFQRRRSALGPVLFFVAGALVTGSVALVLAPTSGKKLRAKIVGLVGLARDNAPASNGSQDPTTGERSGDAVVGGSNVSLDGHHPAQMRDQS